MHACEPRLTRQGQVGMERLACMPASWGDEPQPQYTTPSVVVEGDVRDVCK